MLNFSNARFTNAIEALIDFQNYKAVCEKRIIDLKKQAILQKIRQFLMIAATIALCLIGVWSMVYSALFLNLYTLILTVGAIIGASCTLIWSYDAESAAYMAKNKQEWQHYRIQNCNDGISSASREITNQLARLV